jgi:hypothetical protein
MIIANEMFLGTCVGYSREGLMMKKKTKRQENKMQQKISTHQIYIIIPCPIPFFQEPKLKKRRHARREKKSEKSVK